MKKQVHINSKLSFWELKEGLPKMQKYIYDTIARCYDPLTDRGVKEITRCDDMNSVRPRITELIKMGLVKEVGSTICQVTGKRVRLVTSPESANYWKIELEAIKC